MIPRTLRRVLTATSVAAILTAVMPLVPDEFGGASPFDASSAAARKGGDSSGSGGGDDSGGDNGGHGGDNGDGDDNSGPGGGDDDRDDDSSGRRGGHRVDGATGAKIEMDGRHIEVVYPDGWKEELENGIFELKDPAGRTVIERRATPDDFARLRALAN